MDLTAFGPYALNIRTNISSFESRPRLIRAKYHSSFSTKFKFTLVSSDILTIFKFLFPDLWPQCYVYYQQLYRISDLSVQEFSLKKFAQQFKVKKCNCFAPRSEEDSDRFESVILLRCEYDLPVYSNSFPGG